MCAIPFLSRLLSAPTKPAPAARKPAPGPPRWPLARHYGPLNQLPLGTIARGTRRNGANPPLVLDLTADLAAVCRDVAMNCPTLSHVRPEQILVTWTASRNRHRHGLLARTTPLRFRGGALRVRRRGQEFQAQRFTRDGVELLYLVTFCLPRFWEQSFEEKLITVFHELYHVGPRFDGDLRRHGGRYDLHTHSQKCYDAAMARLVGDYLAQGPTPGVLDNLRLDLDELRSRAHLVGVRVPRPVMIRVGSA